MNRCLAILLALLCTSMTIASACSANVSDQVHFTLQPDRHSPEIYASFRNEDRGPHDNQWSTSIPAGHLVGLDVAAFRAAGTRPLRFAIIREAGRLDCAGHGGESYAGGNCSFTPDQGFNRLLQQRGIGSPTREQAFGLMAVNARRELIDAVAAARYPAPTIDQLMAMTAVGVDRSYINELARLGYRPRSIQSLVEFRALDITPAFIAGFARMGYPADADSLVQLKALDVTPEYAAAFQRLGYGRLPADKLVELKALGITPEYAQSVGRGSTMPIDALVERKIFGGKQ